MPGQMSLRPIRLDGPDGFLDLDCAFPFFDRSLSVRFLLAVSGAGLHVLRGRAHRSSPGRLDYHPYSRGRPIDLASVHPAEFEGLFHFDPWWMMRGETRCPDAVCRAIIATNVAGRRSGRLEIRDVIFDDAFHRAARIRVGDGVFRPVDYGADRPLPEALRSALLG